MDFFAAHADYAWIFLICMFLFPRLTMLFAVATPFTIFMWLGWFFVPEILVAIMAYSMYWTTNPDLVIVAGVWALMRVLARGRIVQHQSQEPLKR